MYRKLTLHSTILNRKMIARNITENNESHFNQNDLGYLKKQSEEYNKSDE